MSKFAALPAETRAYCAHEYTVANLRFARAVEPDNAALREREIAEQAKRERLDPTVPSTIALERASNPFLRAGEPVVRAAAEAHAGHPLRDDVAAFAELRAWKNVFAERVERCNGSPPRCALRYSPLGRPGGRH